MPSAYQSRPYDDRYSSARMSDLMREAGAVQAQGIQQRGQNTAATIGRMADLVGTAVQAGVQAHRQTKAQQEADKLAAEKQRIGDAVKSAIDPATGRLDFTAAAKAIGQIDPLKAEEFWAKADEQQRKAAEREADEMEEVAKGLGTVLLTAQQDAAKATAAYATWRADALKRKLIEPDEFPEQYDAAVVQQQALFKYLPAAEVFKQLFSAKNAPQRSTKVVNDKIIDDQTGKVIYDGTGTGSGEVIETVDAKGRPVRRRVTEAELAAGVPVYKPPQAPKDDPDRITKAQRNAAITARRAEIQRIDAMLADDKIDQGQYDRMRWETEKDYALKVGEPEPPPPRQFGPQDVQASGGTTSYEAAAARNAGGPSMRDLVQPAPAGRPASPLGAAPATAAPTNRPAPEIERALKAEGPGEYDLADGSTWRVYPDGRMERVK